MANGVDEREEGGTMNEDREAFWAKIEENPADAACKLVFADWLEEHGEEDLAYCMRWCAGHSKCPAYFDNGGVAYWTWLRLRFSEDATVVGDALINQMANYDSIIFLTPQRAYAALTKALKELREVIAIPAPKYAEVTDGEG